MIPRTIFLAIVFGVSLFYFFGFIPTVATATNLSGALPTSKMLTRIESPYVVSGTVTQSSSGTLTIEPGVVVKFNPGANLRIDGKLLANGTAVNPITFTSAKDDTVAGDTNGDGAATTPAPGDWGYLLFGANSSISNITVRYGGANAWNGIFAELVASGAGEKTITESEISHSLHAGVYNYNDSVRILTSDIHDNETGIFSSPLQSASGAARLLTLEDSTIRVNTLYGIKTATYVPPSGSKLSNSLAYNRNQFTNNSRPLAIDVTTEINHAGNIFSNNERNGAVVFGASSANAKISFGAGDGPYIIEAPLTPRLGTMTFDPGAVIKFDTNALFNPHGDVALNFGGTMESPVFFTSLRDDSLLGDTNGDGGATSPAPGDWGYVAWSPRPSPFAENFYTSHLRVRYGGGLLLDGVYPAFKIGFGQFGFNPPPDDTYFENIEVSESIDGLRINVTSDTTTFVRASSLRDNENLGLTIGTGGEPITATGNWWGSATGPYHPTLNPGGTGNGVGSGITFVPWLLADPFPTLLPPCTEPVECAPPSNLPPVLSEANVSPEEGIRDITPFVFRVTYSDPENDPPAFVRVVVDGASHDMADDGSGAYTFSSTFPIGSHTYHFEAGDGEFSARFPETGELSFEATPLDPAIIIPGILGSWTKNGEWIIDPVLHTYDNLIATLDANGYTPDLDLFTFPYDWRISNVLTAVALEHKIEDMKAICQCEKIDLIAHSMGGLVARQYIQSPQYNHDVDQLIFLATPHLGSPDSYLTWEAGEPAPKPNSWLLDRILKQQAKENGFDNVFEYVHQYPVITVNQLLPISNYIKDDQTNIIRTYPTLYSRNTFLEDLNNGLQNLYDSEVKLTNITAREPSDNTINIIRVVTPNLLPLWEHGYPEGFNEELGDRGLERGVGDGTVSLTSAQFIDQDLHELNSNHHKIVTDGQVLAFEKLTSTSPNTVITNLDRVGKKFLLLQLFSPVDILVTTPDGKQIGKNFSTGEEINEIPGAFYSGFLTDDEYLTIPDPLSGEYIITVKGTDTGEYTIATGYITDEELIENDFTAHTFTDLETSIELNLDTENPENTTVTPEDTTPPTIIITSPESRDYMRTDVFQIITSITDDSGVLSSEITLDGVVVSNEEIIDLFYRPLGDHTLAVTATDYVGNTATLEQHFRSITTLSGMLKDIDRLFTDGEIKTVGARDSLKSKINDALASRNWKKVMTSSFMKELDYQLSKKRITQTAYNILKEDYQWVINH